MDDQKELELALNETYEQVKKEHKKILKIFQNLNDETFGEGCTFKNIDEYNAGLALLSNVMTYALQLNQAKKVQQASRENASKDKVIPFSKPQKD